MIVCSCNVLSDSQIRTTIGDSSANCRTPGQVYRCLGCSPQCGRCARTIRAMLADVRGLTPREDDACGVCPAACPSVTHGHGAVVGFTDDVVEVATLDRATLLRP